MPSGGFPETCLLVSQLHLLGNLIGIFALIGEGLSAITVSTWPSLAHRGSIHVDALVVELLELLLKLVLKLWWLGVGWRPEWMRPLRGLERLLSVWTGTLTHWRHDWRFRAELLQMTGVVLECN